MKYLSLSFLCFILNSIIYCQDYYVDDNGSDSNPGSESLPFKTINKALEFVEAGGTIYVMDGIYSDQSAGVPIVSFYEDSSQQDSAGNNYVYSNGNNLNNPHVVTINKSGNEIDGYITLKNYPNHNPKIIFNGQGGIKLGSNANYIIVEGFEVEGPSQSITYNQAIMNRRNRITLKESINQNNNNYSYFSGKGIWGGYDDHHHIIIKNNIVTFSNSLGDITAIDVNNGSLIWQKFTQNSEIYENIMTLKMSDLVINNESIYFSNNKNQFYSIDANTGITNWIQKINSNIKPSIIGNFIFTISTDGYFFIIEKNTGNILRITNVFNSLKKKKNEMIYPTGFIFNFQDLFISTNNGKLIIIDIKTGKIKNILNIDNDIISRPIVQNQNMYLIKDNSIVRLN